MKTKITMLLSVMLMVTASVFSQNNQRRTVAERVKAVMEKLAPLGLDQSQLFKTDSVFTAFYKNQKKMREDMRASGERPDRSAFEKPMAARDEELKKIFTDDQYKKYKDEIEPAMRPQRRADN